MLFQAVVRFLPILNFLKISWKRGKVHYISQINFIRRGIRCYTILIILLVAIYQQPSLLVVVQTFVSQAITNAISAWIIYISLPEYFN